MELLVEGKGSNESGGYNSGQKTGCAGPKVRPANRPTGTVACSDLRKPPTRMSIIAIFRPSTAIFGAQWTKGNLSGGTAKNYSCLVWANPPPPRLALPFQNDSVLQRTIRAFSAIGDFFQSRFQTKPPTSRSPLKLELATSSSNAKTRKQAPSKKPTPGGWFQTPT